MIDRICAIVQPKQLQQQEVTQASFRGCLPSETEPDQENELIPQNQLKTRFDLQNIQHMQVCVMQLPCSV